MRREWEIIPECNNEETGEPQQWACKVDSKKYGTYVWITKASDTQYDVEYMKKVGDYEDIFVLKPCKSLTSAKRWVAMNI